MRPIFASLSAFALLGVVSAADVGTSCHYDFSRQKTRLARGPVENEPDHPTEHKTPLRVVALDFMLAQLGPLEFLPEIEREMRDLTSFSPCWQEVGGHDDLDGDVGRLCAALMHPR